MFTIETDLKYLALFVSAIFIGGTSWAMPLLNNDFMNATWLVVQTITTTGYGSFPNDFWTSGLKALSICLMLVGVTYWTLLIGALSKYFWP